VGEPSADRYLLLEDGTLTLAVEEQCLRLIGAWLPMGARRSEHGGRAPASIAVLSGADVVQSHSPDSPPTLRIGSVRAWLDHEANHAMLAGANGAGGEIDLAGHRARLALPPSAGDAAAADLQPMLTIAAALLLGRIGRILLHAGAVVSGDGRAWLVVGDAYSGKSTTCISLALSGWDLLSDDQVVLQGPGSGVPRAEGWLRPLHLDEGWELRTPRGTRRTVVPASLGLRAVSGPIEVAGTLHTSVEAGQPTTASMTSATEAFIGLVRQSPWLLADRAAAPAIVERLSALARLPSVAISLGRDTFGRPDALRAVVEDSLIRNGIA
jgi:hypothetical protein